MDGSLSTFKKKINIIYEFLQIKKPTEITGNYFP